MGSNMHCISATVISFWLFSNGTSCSMGKKEIGPQKSNSFFQKCQFQFLTHFKLTKLLPCPLVDISQIREAEILKVEYLLLPIQKLTYHQHLSVTCRCFKLEGNKEFFPPSLAQFFKRRKRRAYDEIEQHTVVLKNKGFAPFSIRVKDLLL